MIFKPFLTSEDISSLQIQEAQSSKKQKRTPEQIEAIYSYGNNILVSASALGKPLSWLNALLIKFCVV